MKTEINQQELSEILDLTFDKDSFVHPWENLLSFCLYETGLRVNECIEAHSRWHIFESGAFWYLEVNLSKGENTRVIQMPFEKLEYFMKFYDIRNYMFGTYSSYNHWLRKRLPIITVNSDVRRTTSHLYRYNFIKKLSIEGYTNAEIKNEIVHESQGSTDRYIYDKIYLNH